MEINQFDVRCSADGNYRMVFHRYEYVHDFSVHPIDGSVCHRCGIRSVVHFGGSNDVDSKPIPSRMFCGNLSTRMVVRPCGIYECGRSNRVES